MDIQKSNIMFSLAAVFFLGYFTTIYSKDVNSENVVIVSGDDLTIQNVVDVARNNFKVVFSDEAIKRVEASRKSVDELVDKEAVVYGLTTGFGSLASVSISKEQAQKLQTNLIRSHAVGVGPAFPEDVVRAAMLLRVNAFAQGASGGDD